MDTLTTIIIGAGHAGVHAAATLRNKGDAGRIVLIDEEQGLPYERPPLSKDVLLGKSEPPEMRKAKFYADRQIELMTGARVESIDRSAACIRLKNGNAIEYDRVLIATGSRARPFNVDGIGLEGVFLLRTKADALRIRSALASEARVVIIGAGYIGLEVAAAAAMAGANVTVIEREDRVLSRVTSEPVSSHFQGLHESHGVGFLFGRTVSAIDGEQRVRQVLTMEGDVLPVDLVVVGVGVVADDRLAHEAGLLCDDGIIVDAQGRTSDPAIYAAGDVARFCHPLVGRTLRLECISNAVAQAERAVNAMLELPTAEYEVPWFWSLQYDCRLQSAGIRLPGDSAIVRGDPISGRFSVLYLRGQQLAAIDAVGMGSDFISARKLISPSATVVPALLADSTKPLSEALLS